MKKAFSIYELSVLCAGMCWGFMGLFTRNLAKFGIGSAGAIIVRCAVAAVCFGILIAVKDPRGFAVKPKDFWCFIGTGIFSLLFFTYCYFNAIRLLSLSAAAILLYIAPTVVMLLSSVLFREKITWVKALAVAVSFVGCSLVSGISGGTDINVKGILFGIGAGLGYALYTIFSRYAIIRGYTSNTVNFYSCVLAFAGALIIWGGSEAAVAFTSAASVLWSLGLGVFTCFIPYMLYTYGLYGLENSKASVLASVEPVVASLIGITVFGEKMTLANALGIILVIGAILLLNAKIAKKKS